MNCKEFERIIPSFIHREIDYPKLKEFSEHMKGCADCREELTIQFLVSEGMQHLEEGDSFDLQKELKERMEEARHAMKRQKKLSGLGTVFELLGIGISVGALVWLFFA